MGILIEKGTSYYNPQTPLRNSVLQITYNVKVGGLDFASIESALDSALDSAAPGLTAFIRGKEDAGANTIIAGSGPNASGDRTIEIIPNSEVDRTKQFIEDFFAAQGVEAYTVKEH